MMPSAERSLLRERTVSESPGDRGDHRHFEKLRGRERRQNGGQACGKHRFAGARRPDHEQVVSAGRRDLERALGALLAFDVLELDEWGLADADFWLWPREHLRPA